MPLLDVKKETEIFKDKLNSGYYPLERSKNTEVDYAKEKEARDTKAVDDFVKSELFEEIVSNR